MPISGSTSFKRQATPRPNTRCCEYLSALITNAVTGKIDVTIDPALQHHDTLARFSIAENNSAQASRIIAETIDAKLIKPSDPGN